MSGSPVPAGGYRGVMRLVPPAATLVTAVVLTGGCGGDGAATPDAGSARAPRSAETTAAAETTTTNGGSNLGGVTVVGEGTVEATPDTARLVLGVEVVRPDVAAAFSEANAAAQDVLRALREGGVADEDIRTQDLSVRERHRPDPGPRPAEADPDVSGYVVSHLFEVTVRDLDRLDTLVADAVDAAGDAARVQRVGLFVEQDDTRLRQAREEAFSDARSKAEQYAELAGRTLGEVDSVSEVIGVVGPTPPAAESAADAAAPPIQRGQQEITVRLQASWRLE